MKRCFDHERNFRPDSLETIVQADMIVEEYLADGLRLTLRQLYYQFVARGLSENSQRAYKRIGALVSDGRMAGLLDWDGIEDRTRNATTWPGWSDPGTFAYEMAGRYIGKVREGQGAHVELWVEKEALAGVLYDVAARWRVPLLSCKGYLSTSETYQSARRMIRALTHSGALECVVIYMGDHDPSGLDMPLDLFRRLEGFGVQGLEVRRVALTMSQIEETGAPPAPVKLTDSRAVGYVEQWGRNVWELDALEPRTLQRLAEGAIREETDEGLFDAAMKRERHDERVLRAIAGDFNTLALEYEGRAREEDNDDE